MARAGSEYGGAVPAVFPAGPAGRRAVRQWVNAQHGCRHRISVKLPTFRNILAARCVCQNSLVQHAESWIRSGCARRPDGLPLCSGSPVYLRVRTYLARLADAKMFRPSLLPLTLCAPADDSFRPKMRWRAPAMAIYLLYGYCHAAVDDGTGGWYHINNETYFLSVYEGRLAKRGMHTGKRDADRKEERPFWRPPHRQATPAARATVCRGTCGWLCG